MLNSKRALASLLFCLSGALCSPGDRSTVQVNCIRACSEANCTDGAAFAERQPIAERLLLWSCEDDCRYNCMWETVAAFKSRGFYVPQFHGKWPFVRVLGVQEAASALFSVFNLLPHVFMLRRLRSVVPAGARMRNVWTLYGVVSINTWTWSTIFHTRDFEFTEHMDYFCAFSVVVFSLLAFFLRLFGDDGDNKSVRGLFLRALTTSLCAIVFLNHVYAMAFVRFDYGWNMKLNIAVGAVNSVLWFAWSYRNWTRCDHVRYCVLAVLMLNLSILLELLDFVPWLWLVDSHALWHLSTAPIHLVWYEFAIRDCLALVKEDEERLVKNAKTA